MKPVIWQSTVLWKENRWICFSTFFFSMSKAFINIPLSRAGLRFNGKSICFVYVKTNALSPSLSCLKWRRAEYPSCHQTSIIMSLIAGNGLLLSPSGSKLLTIFSSLQLYQPILRAIKLDVCRPLVKFWRWELAGCIWMSNLKMHWILISPGRLSILFCKHFCTAVLETCCKWKSPHWSLVVWSYH